jgi:transcriptional regulator with XRE-family HTH domain
MTPIKRASKTIRRLRMERGLSQQALATKEKISRGYLARLEAAEQDPTLGVLERLAKALGVPVTALLE